MFLDSKNYSTHVFCASLSSHCLSLSLSFRVWQHSHCDYLRPLFEIQDLAVSIPPEKIFRAWNVALSQYGELKDCEIERESGRGGGRETDSTPLHQSGSSVIAVTVLFKRRQITAHCWMPPSSTAPLSEISPIPRHLRDPACLRSLTVH